MSCLGKKVVDHSQNMLFQVRTWPITYRMSCLRKKVVDRSQNMLFQAMTWHIECHTPDDDVASRMLHVANHRAMCCFTHEIRHSNM